MIITCPDCSKRYVVSEASIGEEGRTVKCANCEHQWFQAGSKPKPPRTYQDEEPDLDFDGVDEPVDEPLTDFQGLLDQEMEAVLEEEGPPEEPQEEPQEDIPDAVKPIEEEEPEIKVQAPPQVWQPLTGGYGAALVIFFILFGGFAVVKDGIVKAWPPSALIYNMVGMETKVPGEGLIFDRIVAKADKNTNGQNIVKLSGAVINLTEDAVKLPPVLASLVMPSGEPQDQWLIDLGAEKIMAEEAIPFEVDYPLSSEEFESVTVTFLAGAPKTQKKEEAN